MSTTKITKLSRASLAGAVMFIAAWLLLSATQARAETVKGRGVTHTTKLESIEVGDTPGQSVNVSEYKGLVFFENGEVATSSEVEMSEETKGSGTFKVYSLYTFEDGSTQFIKFQGTFTTVQEGKPVLFEGTYTYVRGTGRFEGIQGSGSCDGKNFGEAGLYYDFTGTYTLPKK